MFSGELKSLFGVVLEVDALLVLLESFGRVEHHSHPLVSLVLPALSVALNGLSLGKRLANDVQEPVATLAIYSYLCVTFLVRTPPTWVTLVLASVSANGFAFAAGFSATLLKEEFF
jgi:hypothetical protein